MKKIPYVLTIFLCGLVVLSITAKGFHSKEDVSPKKWEKIALSTIRDKYHGASFKEYEYIGRTAVNNEQTKDVFRVTVQKHKKTFSAHAEVYFHPVTKHIISVNVFRL